MPSVFVNVLHQLDKELKKFGQAKKAVGGLNLGGGSQIKKEKVNAKTEQKGGGVVL